MYSYERSLAAPAISPIVPDPSLQRVCICKSPRSHFDQAGFVASSRLASASEIKSRRISGILLFGGVVFKTQPQFVSRKTGQLSAARASIGFAPQLELPLPATETRCERL